tara:strand:+ start:6471 stop:7847 length:1377 start_codon:yes stop_codon:yes gene_type:complete
MKIIICGAGLSGRAIAEKLSQIGNEVTIIDSSKNLIEKLGSELDIRGIVGHGAHPDILGEAGASDAEMLIAVTPSDEINMMACQVAHSLFEVPKRIARVRDKSYLNPSYQDLFISSNLPVNIIISPEKEVANSVFRRFELPGTFENVPFGDNKLRFLGVKVDADCPIKNTDIGSLTDLFPDLNTVIVGLNRDGVIITPKTNEKLIENDLAYLICPSDYAARTLSIFGNQIEIARRIVLVGGGSIGKEVGKLIENNTENISLRIIDLDKKNADDLSDKFDKSFVILGSGMDKDILNEAEISSADILISLTNSDETNFISAAFAKSDGCQRVIALLNNKDFQGLIRSVDIGDFIDPKAITVSSILRHVRRGRIRNIYTLSDGSAEVIEGEVSSSSELVGPTIEDLHLADGLRIGGILRNNEIIMPRGDTKIKEGDYVTIFSIPSKIHEVEQLFRVSASYY